MNRRLTVLAVVLACTACAPTASTTGSEPAPTTTAPTPIGLSAGGRSQAPGGTAPATLGIAWDEPSKAAALATATKAMTLYARPTVTDKTWIQDLGQLLTAQATSDYQDTDPSTIPATKVTGTGQLTIDAGNGFGCHVTIPTDAGAYDVQLLRPAADRPWQVSRITPPTK